jgi:fluoride exporter
MHKCLSNGIVTGAAGRSSVHSRPRRMQSTLLVFLGGGIGSVLRYGFNVAAARLLDTNFPWGTFGVNVLGGLIMGLIAGILASRSADPYAINARLFLMTGVLGGFTTFSAFSLDAVALWQRGETASAFAYVVGSCVLSIAALALGLAAARQWA